MKKIHLIAVCGTGMASLAGLLKDKGYTVTGSDQNMYPPMSDQLAEMKITLRSSFSKKNIDELAPDTVIVGNAVSKTNEEAQAVLEKKLPLLSMPQALYELFLAERFPLVVTGTHGKTTTSGLLAWVLERTGQSPGFFVGGILQNFDRSYQLGTGDYFVVEGDEYDSAFFDKGPKFLHYKPKMLILNAVEFDHADIYRDLDHMMESFEKLITNLSKDSIIFADGDNENVRKLIAKAPCRVLTFGLEGKRDLEAQSIQMGENVQFQLTRSGKNLGLMTSPLLGRHNLKNLLGVLGIALELGIPLADIQTALSEFKGLKRRQEVLGTFRGVTLIEDFAHHPTAIRETLAAIRAKYPKSKLWAIFEPRSNTTRRKVFEKEFQTAFDDADESIFAAPYQIEKIPESDRLEPSHVIDGLTKRGKKARYVPAVEEIVATVSKEAKSGDVICFMSNGGFGGIYEKMIASLR